MKSAEPQLLQEKCPPIHAIWTIQHLWASTTDKDSKDAEVSPLKRTSGMECTIEPRKCSLPKRKANICLKPTCVWFPSATSIASSLGCFWYLVWVQEKNTAWVLQRLWFVGVYCQLSLVSQQVCRPKKPASRAVCCPWSISSSNRLQNLTNLRYTSCKGGKNNAKVRTSNHRIPSYPSSEKLRVEHLERKYPRRFSQDLGCISSLSVVACVSCGTPIHTKSKAQKSWGITQAVCAQHTSSNSMFTMFDMIECFVSFYGNVDTKSQLDHSWTRNESCLGRITYNDKEVNNNKTHHSQVDKARSHCKVLPHLASTLHVSRGPRGEIKTWHVLTVPATHWSLLGKGMTKATHRKPATLLCWCLWLPVRTYL